MAISGPSGGVGGPASCAMWYTHEQCASFIQWVLVGTPMAVMPVGDTTSCCTTRAPRPASKEGSGKVSAMDEQLPLDVWHHGSDVWHHGPIVWHHGPIVWRRTKCLAQDQMFGVTVSG